MINRNFLIILVGLPSSGKSTIATFLQYKLQENLNDINVEIVDTDKIRSSINPNKFNHNKEQLVRKRSLSKIKAGLKKGSVIISDDLNYYTSMRHDLKQIAEQYKKEFFIIHIATPLEKCLEWNKSRGFPIPDGVIYNINEKFDYFNKYSWDNPLLVIDPSKSKDLEKIIDTLIIAIEHKLGIKTIYNQLDRKKTAKQQYHEKLDKITRNLIREINQNNEYRPLMKKIAKIRKEFIKKNIDQLFNDTQISEEFLNFINRRLNLDFS
ncbi:MAG: adenylyl-sulfate kinase [Candidatus Heimdallarchaeota archaeon]